MSRLCFVVEIFLYTPDVMVTVFRDHRPSGEGWGFYAQSPEGGSTLRHFPATGKSGRLGVRRSGDQLTFLPPGYSSCLLGGSQDYDSQAVVTATSRHLGGVNLMTGDGSVRFVKASVSAGVWTALGTVAGGEMVDANAY